MQMLIEIDDDHDRIQIKTVEANGVSTIKVIEPEDLAIALANQAKLETELLPRNTRFYSRSEATEVLALEIPEHPRNLFFQQKDGFLVPMPTTLFVVTLQKIGVNRRMYSTSVFCLREPLTSFDTSLYGFPFGNASMGSGDICWGSVTVPTFPTLSAVGGVPDIFLSSIFNGHLDERTFTTFRNDDDVEIFRGSHLMKYLNGKELFPYNALIRVKSFGDAIKRGVRA